MCPPLRDPYPFPLPQPCKKTQPEILVTSTLPHLPVTPLLVPAHPEPLPVAAACPSSTHLQTRSGPNRCSSGPACIGGSTGSRSSTCGLRCSDRADSRLSGLRRICCRCGCDIFCRFGRRILAGWRRGRWRWGSGLLGLGEGRSKSRRGGLLCTWLLLKGGRGCGEEKVNESGKDEKEERGI